MFASDDEQLGLAENLFQEVAPDDLTREFVGRVVNQSDGPPELIFGPPDGWSQRGQAHAADDIQVDIAARALAPFRDRPEHKCALDALLVRLQRRAEYLDHPRSLDDEPPQFREHRRGVVRSKVDPVALDPAAENPGVRQSREVALKTRRAKPDVPCQMTEVPPLLRMHQRRREDGLGRTGEQRGEQL